MAATSAAVLLLVGYALQIASASGSFPASLVTAGWVLALIAAVSTLLALTTLLRTTLHQRGGQPGAWAGSGVRRPTRRPLNAPRGTTR